MQLSLLQSLSGGALPQASGLSERAVPEVLALHAAGVSPFSPHRRSSRVAPAPLPVTDSLVSAATQAAHATIAGADPNKASESALLVPTAQRSPLQPGAFPEPTAPAVPNAPLGHMETHDQSEGHLPQQQQPALEISPGASAAVVVEDSSSSDSGLVFLLQSEGRITWGLDPQHALTQLAQVPPLLFPP